MEKEAVFSGVSGIFSQLISEEDGWEEEGESYGGNRGEDVVEWRGRGTG